MRKKDLYRYVYLICNKQDESVFFETCRIIEDNLDVLKERGTFEIFDMSVVQIYYYGDRKIAVYNDACIGVVCVCSDVDIGNILGVDSIY